MHYIYNYLYQIFFLRGLVQDILMNGNCTRYINGNLKVEFLPSPTQFFLVFVKICLNLMRKQFIKRLKICM